MKHVLENPPLKEIVMEIKWELVTSEADDDLRSDPHHKLLLSRFFDKISGPDGKYPIYNELPQAKFPEELLAHQVIHRFSLEEVPNSSVQLGPGVLALNKNHKNYTWEDFNKKAVWLRDKLFEVHPKPSELNFEEFNLTYLNALPFDHDNNNIYEFIKNELNFEVKLPQDFFKHNLSQTSSSLVVNTVFSSVNPNGNVRLKVGTGYGGDEPVVIFEITFSMNDIDETDEFIKNKDNFEKRLTEMHEIIENVFFSLGNY